MSWDEFTTLLAGISDKTALGRIVAVRSENDAEMLKHFTKEQKRIRKEWRNRNAKEVDVKNYDVAMKNFENMFMALAK